MRALPLRKQHIIEAMCTIKNAQLSCEQRDRIALAAAQMYADSKRTRKGDITTHERQATKHAAQRHKRMRDVLVVSRFRISAQQGGIRTMRRERALKRALKRAKRGRIMGGRGDEVGFERLAQSV